MDIEYFPTVNVVLYPTHGEQGVSAYNKRFHYKRRPRPEDGAGSKILYGT